jgi:hypothetical protein
MLQGLPINAETTSTKVLQNSNTYLIIKGISKPTPTSFLPSKVKEIVKPS